MTLIRICRRDKSESSSFEATVSASGTEFFTFGNDSNPFADAVGLPEAKNLSPVSFRTASVTGELSFFVENYVNAVTR